MNSGVKKPENIGLKRNPPKWTKSIKKNFLFLESFPMGI